MILLQGIALASAGLFAGGAIYISIAEHPGRTRAGLDVALAEFGPSYARAAPWQAGTALLCLVSALACALMGAGPLWAVGGLSVGLVVPLTLIVIFPVNHRLLAEDPPPTPEEATGLLRRWGRLHLLRSALGAAGFVLLIAAALIG